MIDPSPALLAVDFANTLEVVRGQVHDHLAGIEGLRGWLAGAEAIDPALIDRVLAVPPSARIAHDEALRLRAAIRALIESHAAGDDVAPGVALALDRVVAGSTTVHDVARSGRALSLRPRERGHSPLALLAPIARSAVRITSAVDPVRLRPCAAPRCPAWFVDTSKGGRRRWCSMARCGNRRKAARHRGRSASGR